MPQLKNEQDSVLEDLSKQTAAYDQIIWTGQRKLFKHVYWNINTGNKKNH